MDSEVASQLAAIRRLHELDQERWAAERELEETPRKLSEERAAVTAAGTERDGLGEALAATKASIREGEREIDVIARKYKRAADRMPHLAVSSQIEATQREMAGHAEARDALEMTVLEAMELADEQAVALAGAAELVASLEGVLAERTAAWEARAGGLQETAGRLAHVREEVAAPLPSDLMRRYRGGVNASSAGRRVKGGATTVSDATCDTCWAQIPRRWVNETLARKAVYCCQTCKRVLLVDPEVAEEASVAG